MQDDDEFEDRRHSPRAAAQWRSNTATQLLGLERMPSLPQLVLHNRQQQRQLQRSSSAAAAAASESAATALGGHHSMAERVLGGGQQQGLLLQEPWQQQQQPQQLLPLAVALPRPPLPALQPQWRTVMQVQEQAQGPYGAPAFGHQAAPEIIMPQATGSMIVSKLGRQAVLRRVGSGCTGSLHPGRPAPPLRPQPAAPTRGWPCIGGLPQAGHL